ncbi:MAG: ABC transporter permease subunit [Myxococcota bacterium]|nr:ABC transporter permease subunit [Myxococcota bacterium]
MKALWLIGQKFLHFLLVCFGSSLLLAGFLWVSGGSPGRPRLPVDWNRVVEGQTVLCKQFDSAVCGTVDSAGSDDEPLVLRVAGRVEAEGRSDLEILGSQGEVTLVGVKRREAAQPGPSFNRWFFETFWGGILSGTLQTEVGGADARARVAGAARQTLPVVFAALVLALSLAAGGVALLIWLPFPALRGLLRALLLVLSITPVFILGYILQGYGPPFVPNETTPAILLAAVLVLALGDGNLGEIVIEFENEVQALRSQDYVHAARLRGASPMRHMLPGLLLPLSAISAGKVAFLLGSVVIVERHWLLLDGLGNASLIAAGTPKIPPDPVLLIVVTVVVTAVVALVGLVREVLEILVDPRLRRSHSGTG